MPRIQISEPDKTPQPYKVKLGQKLIKLGRASDNNIQLTDPSSSSHHCTIRRVQGGFIIEDQDSTNGIKLEDQRFSKIDLNLDLDFKIGDVEVSVTFSEEEYDILSEEGDFTTEQKLMLPSEKKKQTKQKKVVEEEIELDEEEEDEEDEEEEAPKETPKKRSSSRASRIAKAIEEEEQPPVRPKAPASFTQTKRSSPVMATIFLLLCFVGFLAGLCIKHKEKNGTWLWDDLLESHTTEQTK